MAHSRHSAEIWLENDPEDKDAAINQMILVMNPPPELKQQLVGSVVFNGGDPLDLNNYTVSRSLQGCYIWEGFGQTTQNSRREQFGKRSAAAWRRWSEPTYR